MPIAAGRVSRSYFRSGDVGGGRAGRTPRDRQPETAVVRPAGHRARFSRGENDDAEFFQVLSSETRSFDSIGVSTRPEIEAICKAVHQYAAWNPGVAQKFPECSSGRRFFS